MKALNEFLRPEFINRVDEVVCFNQLSEENFRSIAALMLSELRDVMAEKNITLTCWMRSPSPTAIPTISAPIWC